MTPYGPLIYKKLAQHAYANLATRSQSIQERVNYLQCLLGNWPKSSDTKALTKHFIRNVVGWPTVTASQFQIHARNFPAKNNASVLPQRVQLLLH